jgi:hypothetical protein
MLGSHREGWLMTNTEQRPGMTLKVGETADDAVQNSAPTFAATQPEDVFGALRSGESRSRSRGWMQVSLPKRSGDMFAIDTDAACRMKMVYWVIRKEVP